MAGIVNKVYLLPVLCRVSGVGVVGCGCEDGCRAFCKKKNLHGVGWDPGFPVARKARNCNASDKPQHHVPSIPPLFSYI